MTLLVVCVVAAAVFVFVVHGWLRAASRDGDEFERSYQHETDQWAAEIEEVPLDWLDELDDIRRLPEVTA